MKKRSKKEWKRPTIESITAKDLKDTIVASACSGYIVGCISVRISSV